MNGINLVLTVIIAFFVIITVACIAAGDRPSVKRAERRVEFFYSIIGALVCIATVAWLTALFYRLFMGE